MKLEGKVALVTSSSQGIGQGIAVRLAAEGASIVIDYRSHPEGAEETLAKVEAAGGKCHMCGCPNSQGYVLKADLGNVSDVQRMIDESIQHFGKLDILVNNAGIERHAPFWEVTEADMVPVRHRATPTVACSSMLPSIRARRGTLALTLLP